MKPTVPEVEPLVQRLYDGTAPCSRDAGCVGGHLHIVLDDGNIEDGHVQYCLDSATCDDCVTCIKLAKLLTQMSRTQRRKLASMNRRHNSAAEVVAEIRGVVESLAEITSAEHFPVGVKRMDPITIHGNFERDPEDAAAEAFDKCSIGQNLIIETKTKRLRFELTAIEEKP